MLSCFGSLIHNSAGGFPSEGRVQVCSAVRNDPCPQTGTPYLGLAYIKACTSSTARMSRATRKGEDMNGSRRDIPPMYWLAKCFCKMYSTPDEPYPCITCVRYDQYTCSRWHWVMGVFCQTVESAFALYLVHRSGRYWRKLCIPAVVLTDRWYHAKYATLLQMDSTERLLSTSYYS